MIEDILYTTLTLFLVGAISFFLINKTKPAKTRKNNWIKYITYFLLVNGIIICLIYKPAIFPYIVLCISIISLMELGYKTIKYRKYAVGVLSLLVLAPLIYIFIEYGHLNSLVILFSFMLVTIFDAFSQISGQLFGKTKITPKISPMKTCEGFLGGILITVILSFSLRNLINLGVFESIWIGLGISVFCFVGDILASYSKRKLEIKDFSGLLPGHGGFLDRFDSLIFSSVFIFTLHQLSII